MSEPRPVAANLDEHVLAGADHSLLDLVDNVVNRGVVVNGEVLLGLAGVDLIYLRLSAVLCAADRVLPPKRRPRARPR